MNTTWLCSPSHARWLLAEAESLLSFARSSKVQHGFAWLTHTGEIDQTRGLELWINSRMTHSFALASMLGYPEYGALADHGVAALSNVFHDSEYGGYFSVVDHQGEASNDRKEAYAHAFVVLAASSAAAAGRPGAEDLLDNALQVLDKRFFEPESGMHSESWDRCFSECEKYRGINANMHCVEALLAAAAVKNDAALAERAATTTHKTLQWAKQMQWRIPEHFTAGWEIDTHYNADTPAHPFRPFGATIGHWFEWSRLALHAQAGLNAFGLETPAGLYDDALTLFNQAAKTWGSDSHPGFVYTVDWQGAPVVTERMHWVVAEAIAAASVAHYVTEDAHYAELYQAWWEYAAEYLIDRRNGSWFHELSADQVPSDTVWSGKPDIYHAFQATLIPLLPAWPPLGPALAQAPIRT